MVKICGLRTAEAAIVAAAAGADLLGFIFAPSKRQVTASDVAGILAAVRTAGYATPAVGVFVDPGIVQLKRDIAVSGIDMVQLSGEESPDVYAGAAIPIIKAFPAGSQQDSAMLEQQCARWPHASHFLVDAHDPNLRGGTGKLANWDVCRQLAAQRNILLAGGLHPGNVRDAIATVRPFGVDVASGVETDGVKVPGKIREFIANARAAFAQVDGKPVASDGI
jgi:phosphoribosylanthranilate isomerase